jgi:SAM-dependent methyltransferase
MNCRHCGEPLQHVFLDLGFAPPSNDYLAESDLHALEVWFPLRLYVCDECWLVQTEDYSRPDQLFRHDYAYFSSTSSTWVEHARRYVGEMRDRLDLDSHSMVIEVASNDGYLLKHFVAAGIPCLGIEPTASTAAAAEALGIPVLREFFGAQLGHELAARGQQADLILGNNVLAHVPDINDFCIGLRAALKPGGTITLEFPHLLQLIAHTEFDTVYHEHYSYLSLYTVQRILAGAGLRVCDVEQLTTHGGSLRVFACHASDLRENAAAVSSLLSTESSAGLHDLARYSALQTRIEKVKHDFLAFLVDKKREGRKVAAYGAAAKGNTLLNYAGVRPDLLPFVCDAAPSKQGKYLPGSHIPVLPPAALREHKPDFVIILPWNIAHEIIYEHEYIREWGCRFVTAIPELRVLP